jgi:hypothetical protein
LKIVINKTLTILTHHYRYRFTNHITIEADHKKVVPIYHNIIHYHINLGWFYATFNNILAISRRLVLLVEETRGHGENHRPVASHRQTLSDNVVHLVLIDTTTHNSSGHRR